MWIAATGIDVRLTWPKVTYNVNNRATTATKYQVYRSLQPYFTPGDASSPTPVAEVTATEYMDWGVINDPTAYYDVVRAVNVAGPSADSNRVGKFSFTLVPGQ